MGLLKYTFAVDDIQPPALYYVRPGDRLQVQARSSHAAFTLEIHGTIIAPDGKVHEISERLTTLTALSLSTDRFSLGEGMLTHLSITTAETALYRGECFVWVQLVRGLAGAATPYAALIAAYLTTNTFPSYPLTKADYSAEGPGVPWSASGSVAPIPGSEGTYSIPGNNRLRLMGVRLTLTTDATVINRSIYFRIATTAGYLFYYQFSNVQGASLTRNYYLTPHMYAENLVNNIVNAPIDDFLLVAGNILFCEVLNYQAGDTLAAPVFHFERWVRG